MKTVNLCCMDSHTRACAHTHTLMGLSCMFFFLVNFEMKSHFSCIEHMISQNQGQRLAACTESQTVKNTHQMNKPQGVISLVAKIRCHRVIMTFQVQHTQVEQLKNNSWISYKKVEIFPKYQRNKQVPNPFLCFLCFNRFHLVPVLNVLAVTAERVFRSELCVSECAGCDQWLRADCVHSPWPNRATPSDPTQTLHST